MARHRHHRELAKAREVAQHGGQRDCLAVAIAAVLGQQRRRRQEVAALALLVVEQGVGDLLEETERQRDPRAILVRHVGHVAQRPGDGAQRALKAPVAAAKSTMMRFSPTSRRRCRVRYSCSERFSRPSTLRVILRGPPCGSRPSSARPSAVRSDVDARAVAEPRDLVAQVLLDHLPHALQAVFGERGSRPRGWPRGSR